ncbi:hypothetical protein Golomagni_03630 [Golovinomyces magnicellulatus]|nr:hypothetical protein Golomagni_03630 [Golovinomyces magnicellulatus]
MSADVSKGKVALDNKDYQSAVKHFSNALKTSQAPSWLLERSTAYHRLGQHQLALRDANKALVIAIDRGKREIIADAQYRRGIVLHGLKQYGNARVCFNWCKNYNEKKSGLTMWMSKVTTDYDLNGGEQAECNAVTIKEVPENVDDNFDETDQSTELNFKKEDVKAENDTLEVNTSASKPPNSKIRHDWYQSQSHVTVNILAKDIPKESTTVNIKKRSLEISFPSPSSQSTCTFLFEPLYSTIEVTKSSFSVKSHKIEVILHKTITGLKWPTLQCSSSTPVGEEMVLPLKTETNIGETKMMSHAPVYPTSSRNGPKNWDVIVDNEAEEEGIDEPDAFFKTLYKNADPDTKRAMIKSFQESNGTALSTQWSDVGSRKVEIVPPDGVEAKRWDA